MSETKTSNKKRSRSPLKKKFEIIGDYSHEEPWIVEMLEAYEYGELQSVPNSKAVIKKVQEAARNHVQRKQERINIRLTGHDLAQLKHKAEEEGLPYQTLIASILHKYVTGRLVSKGG